MVYLTFVVVHNNTSIWPVSKWKIQTCPSGQLHERALSSFCGVPALNIWELHIKVFLKGCRKSVGFLHIYGSCQMLPSAAVHLSKALNSLQQCSSGVTKIWVTLCTSHFPSRSYLCICLCICTLKSHLRLPEAIQLQFFFWIRRKSCENSSHIALFFWRKCKASNTIAALYSWSLKSFLQKQKK